MTGDIVYAAAAPVVGLDGGAVAAARDWDAPFTACANALLRWASAMAT
jgi:hypothetical protein